MQLHRVLETSNNFFLTLHTTLSTSTRLNYIWNLNFAGTGMLLLLHTFSARINFLSLNEKFTSYFLSGNKVVLQLFTQCFAGWPSRHTPHTSTLSSAQNSWWQLGRLCSISLKPATKAESEWTIFFSHHHSLPAVKYFFCYAAAAAM